MRVIPTPPHASTLIESLRDVGYSLESALADLIDNSVSADASVVDLLVDPEFQRIGVLDDGCGMSETELFEAMRPGSKSPLEARAARDLGRFGLGLKTASFSQCRAVTVVSRKDGQLAAARWNLDRVIETDQWVVEIPDDPLTLPWAEKIGPRGTLVLWQQLDRFAPDAEASAGYAARRISEAAEHISLVFHRFIAGERGLSRVSIRLNGTPLQPIDPFHAHHPATIKGPIDTIQYRGEKITLQTFTLPHRSKVSAADWEQFAGRAGYVKNQGFYLYREKRLILYGTWFGLTRQTELTKLSRVRVDIPSTLDAEWKIDVKKAWAQPPHPVRERLRKLIETLGADSKRVFTGKGHRALTDQRLPVWNRLARHGAINYEVNTAHPMVVELESRMADPDRKLLREILQLVSTSLPFDALFADFGTHAEKVSGPSLDDDTLRHMVDVTCSELLKTQVTLAVIKEMLKTTEPFRSNWVRVEPMITTVTTPLGPHGTI